MDNDEYIKQFLSDLTMHHVMVCFTPDISDGRKLPVVVSDDEDPIG